MMNLLFDVHCQLQYTSSRAEIEKDHNVICVGNHKDLPQDMEDPDIADYAAKNGYMVVTKDVDFVNLCFEKKVPVGVLKGNRLYIISDVKRLIGGKLPNRLFTQD
jgi:predicted nuclease of predicted toxin-antitoxin system